jgi:hypothetical protein
MYLKNKLEYGLKIDSLMNSNIRSSYFSDERFDYVSLLRCTDIKSKYFLIGIAIEIICLADIIKKSNFNYFSINCFLTGICTPLMVFKTKNKGVEAIIDFGYLSLEGIYKYLYNLLKFKHEEFEHHKKIMSKLR